MAAAADAVRFRFTVCTREGRPDETFDVDVYPEWAPRGAQRFMDLVDADYYKDCKIYRVIPGFICQWGVPQNAAEWKKWGENKIKDDPVTQSNTRGMLSFATSGPDARGSQIFINYGDNSSLDEQGFAPFARVVDPKGMEVAEMFHEEKAKIDQNAGKAQGGSYFAHFPDLSYIKNIVRV